MVHRSMSESLYRLPILQIYICVDMYIYFTSLLTTNQWDGLTSMEIK